MNEWMTDSGHWYSRDWADCHPSPPRMFLSLDLLSEYRIQHGAIGPLYVTSSYSTWIFCRGVSGFATDCPLPPACWSTFWKSIFKHQLGCRFDILDNISSFFLVFWHMQLYMSWYIISFLALSLLLKYYSFFQVGPTPVLTSPTDVVFVLSTSGTSTKWCAIISLVFYIGTTVAMDNTDVTWIDSRREQCHSSTCLTIRTNSGLVRPTRVNDRAVCLRMCVLQLAISIYTSVASVNVIFMRWCCGWFAVSSTNSSLFRPPTVSSTNAAAYSTKQRFFMIDLLVLFGINIYAT